MPINNLTEYEIIDFRANLQIDFFEENGWKLLELDDDEFDNTKHALMQDENGKLSTLTFHEDYFIQDGEHKKYSFLEEVTK